MGIVSSQISGFLVLTMIICHIILLLLILPVKILKKDSIMYDYISDVYSWENICKKINNILINYES